jgi:hypothetical protein
MAGKHGKHSLKEKCFTYSGQGVLPAQGNSRYRPDREREVIDQQLIVAHGYV